MSFHIKAKIQIYLLNFSCQNTGANEFIWFYLSKSNFGNLHFNRKNPADSFEIMFWHENSFEILFYMKKHLKLCFEVKVSFESEISFEIMFWLDMKIQKKIIWICVLTKEINLINIYMLLIIIFQINFAFWQEKSWKLSSILCFDR